MKVSLLVVSLTAVVSAYAGSPVPTREEVARKQIVRNAFDVTRDGNGVMRLDPVFTTSLPVGTVNFEHWPAAGYEDDILLEAPQTTLVGRRAVVAGICMPEAPCSFSFIYTFSLNKDYGGKFDTVGIRYVLKRSGAQLAEGLILGTDAKAEYYLREGKEWRPVLEGPERNRMKAAVQAFSEHHKAQVAAVRGQGE